MPVLACGAVQEKPSELESSGTRIKVMSFNVLYGGSNAAGVGFTNEDFGGSRIDEIAEVILQSGAEIVGIQEDASTNVLLDELNKGDDRWFRYGSVYSKFKLVGIEKTDKAFGMTVCQVVISDDLTITFVNTHWHPSPYGPAIIQERLKENPQVDDLADFEKTILAKADKPDGYRGYNVTVEAIKRANQDAPIIVTGDFNESSHLDWTDRFAKEGFDRWGKNPTTTPLRFKIEWSGSRRLMELGLGDAYRTVYPDEVKNPGLTFTPPYPAGTPGRKPIDDQILDRIDIVYFSKSNLTPVSAAVIGESKTWSDRVYGRRWPSDHRAVLAEFRLNVGGHLPR